MPRHGTGRIYPLRTEGADFLGNGPESAEIEAAFPPQRRLAKKSRSRLAAARSSMPP